MHSTPLTTARDLAISAAAIPTLGLEWCQAATLNAAIVACGPFLHRHYSNHSPRQHRAKPDQRPSAWAYAAQSCFNVSHCVGITIWGIADKYSWALSTFSGESSALPWTVNFQKKPAYTAFLDVLNGKNNTKI